MLWRPIKFLFALILLPTAFFTLLETGKILCAVLDNLGAALSFILGVLIYCGIHYGYYNFSRLYVFGHEMTHALAALVCGYRIKDVSVGQDSGYVKMDNCNAFVVLAPYFVPLYVIAAALLYAVTDLFVDLTPYRQVFLFVIGIEVQKAFDVVCHNYERAALGQCVLIVLTFDRALRFGKCDGERTNIGRKCK